MVSKSQWVQMQLAKAEEVGSTSPKHPKVTLKYDRATNNLKKVTKRKIRTGDQVTTFQTEENFLSLTWKRRRAGRSIDMDDRELVDDPGRDRIVASPSMGAEIGGSLKDLYRSFVQVEEAWDRGEETHHRIKGSLNQIEEWETKLATLRNVARRSLLPNISLLELDEVVTCENVLAKTKQILENGHAPLVTSNKQLESSSHNMRALFDSVGLPSVVKPDNSLCSEMELDATLGEFANQFSNIPNQGTYHQHLSDQLGLRQVQGSWGQGKGSLHMTFFPQQQEGRLSLRGHILTDSVARGPIPQGSSKGNHFHPRGDLPSLSGGIQEELKQVKDASQSVSTTTIHVLHELSHVHHKLSLGARSHTPEEEANGMWPTPEDLDRESSMHGSGDHIVRRS
eukprot:Gb_33654 [translate_table: standard]